MWESHVLDKAFNNSLNKNLHALKSSSDSTFLVHRRCSRLEFQLSLTPRLPGLSCRFLGELPISLFLISSLTYLRWYSISSQYSPYYVSSYFKDASPCFDFDNIIARWQCFIHIIDGASISSHTWSWYWRYLILSQYLPRNFASEVSLWKWKSLESRDVICFVILLQNWVISQNEYSSPNGIDSWQRRNKPLVFCVQRHLLFVPWKSISSVLLVFGSSLSKYMYCFVTKYSIVKLLYLDILK